MGNEAQTKGGVTMFLIDKGTYIVDPSPAQPPIRIQRNPWQAVVPTPAGSSDSARSDDWIRIINEECERDKRRAAELAALSQLATSAPIEDAPAVRD